MGILDSNKAHYNQNGNIILQLKERQSCQTMEDKLEISYQQFQKDYFIEGEIGKGGFGVVRRVTHRKTKCRRALKTIMCSNFKDIQAAQQEIQIMSQLHHSRIVKLFEFYQTCYRLSGKGDTTYFGLLLQLGQGSLQQSLRDPSYKYSVSDVRQFLANLIQVGAYLQSKELVHSDIKPANIIIFGPGLQFKIADFGLSCNAGRRPNAFVGSPHYCSPMLREFYYNPKSFVKKPLTNAFKDDVYSVGVTVDEVLRKINFNFREQSSRELQQQMCMILQQMLRIQQNYRPTFEELMQRRLVRKELNIGEFGRRQESIDQDRHFKNIILRENVINQPQTITIKKEPNITLQKQLISKRNYKINYSILAIIVLNKRYVLCGTAEGQLVIFDSQSQKSIELNIKHKKHVSCLAADHCGKIYSGGGDGTIYSFNKELLLDLLQNRTQQKEETKGSLFKKAQTKSKYELVLNKDEYEVIQKPIDKPNISYLYFIDKERFAVGYADGSVLLNWDHKQCCFQNYIGVVTNIKHYQHILFVSFTSGTIIQFNLKQFKKQFRLHEFTDTVLDFTVSQMRSREGYSIEAYTCSGNIQKMQIAESCKPTFHKQTVLKHLIGVSAGQEERFLLSQDGVILHDNEQLLREAGEDWCCLNVDRSVVVCGTLSGGLLMCELRRV